MAEPSGREHRTGQSAPPAAGADVDEVRAAAERIQANIAMVIEGKPEIARSALVVLLAGGHLLIEDVPGVGKTMLAKALARSIDCTVRRIQFTPDLLPSDVTGVSVFNQDTRTFEFRPGGIFANVVVGDEINRASPKTQSAMLECMEEAQVTVDGTTYALESPFMVIATQNPIEMEGTYALPEAQRDRFMVRLSMGYPVESAEIAMLSAREGVSPIEELEPVTDAAEVRKLIEVTSRVHVSAPVQQYAVALATATRRSPDLRLGASPRATLHLVRAAKAWAAIQGREFVLPDDVKDLAPLVLPHRLLPTMEATMSGRRTSEVVEKVPGRRAGPGARARSVVGSLTAASGVRDLTIRGRCFLAAGLAAIICGIQVGERDFVRIGLLAALVPALAWLLMRRTERRVWVRRTVSAVQVEAGETAEVSLVVGADGTGRTGLLLLEEELAPELGQPQRFSLEPMGSREQQSMRYLIRTAHRGRYPIGPLHVRIADATGMVDVRQTISSTGTILVTPRTEPLPRVALTGRWAGAGEDRTRDLVGSGSPDVTIREYRLGDDLRRIHWPSSARAAELMVRREEQQWQSRCTLLIDNRRVAHRGYGADSSMERAVSVAASVARNLVAMDFEVRLVTATDSRSAEEWRQGSRSTDLPAQLERLALLGMTRSEQLSTGWVDESQQGGMIMAVLGHLQHGDRELLAGLAAAGAAAYAVVLDVGAWERTAHHEPPATAWLRARGWKATTLAHDGSLPTAWQELGR